MRYAELLSGLFEARRFGVRLGLERVGRVLEALDHPERRIRARVLVGGTNGKGSTAAFAASIARAAGYRTGLYTSPHLTRFAERFAIDGEPADEEAIVRAAGAVRAAGGADLTFFEQITAMAALLFAEAGVEVAVFEVGLGGRLDATNALDVQVAAVTGVARDHQEHLGGSIEAIAGEKAGIFRPGRAAVVGASGLAEAVPVLCGAAERVGARCRRVGAAEHAAVRDRALGLPGAHQRANAACAVAIARVLSGWLPGLGEKACASGLAAAALPGRMETVAIEPRVVVDGAHNPHAARALAEAIRPLPTGRIALVTGLSRRKDADGILGALAPLATAVVATRFHQRGAMDPERVADAARRAAPGLPVLVRPDAATAVAEARRIAGRQDTILCAGSLFLAGEVRAAELGIEPDPVRVADPMDRK